FHEKPKWRPRLLKRIVRAWFAFSPSIPAQLSWMSPFSGRGHEPRRREEQTAVRRSDGNTAQGKGRDANPRPRPPLRLPLSRFPPACLRAARCWCDRLSQRRTVKSPDPETNRVPSGLKATLWTEAPWPCRSPTGWCGATSQSERGARKPERGTQLNNTNQKIRIIELRPLFPSIRVPLVARLLYFTRARRHQVSSPTCIFGRRVKTAPCWAAKF